MFTMSTHNVTEIVNARIQNSDADRREGWIVINFNAQNYSWSDEPQEDVGGEYTLFFKDLELGLSQLRDALDKGERQLRKAHAEAIKKTEAAGV